ncbi:MAG: hypothetical protein B7Z75_02395 [Acidocella sp. 20-57-95]|nr:MAG: hypothetical protein B7Z75_02395 [Acidocella sp. 20-57-95]OYV61747.1 MAG: hypothetical protein B7Z71_04020 [Acidocella sp. 21-58-7]HQT63854.1 hypothetical protein [Acidocella sp.]
MSDVLATDYQRTRPTISRGWQAGLIVGFASLIIFTLAGERLAMQGYIAAGVQSVWNQPGDNSNIGGQWVQWLLVAIFRLIPGTTAATLSVVTVISASFVQGFMTHDLVKRGWSPLQAVLAVGLTALHPVMLYMATNGAPMLLYGIVAGLVIIALDRFEAISDTQSLIVVGLVFVLLVISWPNAIYFLLPTLVLLPWAFRDVRSYSAATAVFVISIAPTFIVLSGLALAGTLFGIPMHDLLAIWSAPLHGAQLQIVQQSVWLRFYGGKPVLAFFLLTLACMGLMPRVLLIFVRLLSNRQERRRPVTGLAAFFLPPISGALATWFWHLGSIWTVIALSLMCGSAWAATVHFRNWERWLWVASIACGVSAAWLTPFLWFEPDQQLWRQTLLGW